LILGGEGNEPINDPGWPAGAAAVFNCTSRVAYWEGPPFGGGQWHAECRGDAKALSAVLADFAKIALKSKRVIVHDGVASSFWLNPNQEAGKQEASKIDWVFMTWVPSNWERFGNAGMGSRGGTVKSETGSEPPAQIDVYTGGGINWSEVAVPDGIEVTDDRLEAHGFKLTDGTVLEGNVADLADKKPLAARIELQLIEPQKTGGYRYTVATQTKTDAQGHWFIKSAPTGWYQVVVLADGYAPRVAGYAQFDGQAGWHGYKCGLSRLAPIAGRVTDEAGAAIAGAEIHLSDVVGKNGLYTSPNEFRATTDADGRFHLEHTPIGTARVWVNKPGYCRPGLGLEITMPVDNVELKMTPSAQVHVTVDFTDTTRPASYIVSMTPEGGSEVGKWSGSGNINDKNEIKFSDVPPGRYELVGQPNPSNADQKSKSIMLDLRGGATEEVKIEVK
jgi:hypothetical protein